MTKSPIPLTKKEAFDCWLIEAYTLSIAMSRLVGQYNEVLRKISNEQRLRGGTEKRLAKAIEAIEDQADRYSAILLGPDKSQEERDADR